MTEATALLYIAGALMMGLGALAPQSVSVCWVDVSSRVQPASLS